MGPQFDGRLRRRRPVRRRRRARRAAPAVRPLLAQGAVRPGPRVVVRAVPAAVQPGHDPGRGVHRRPRAATSTPPRSSSATAASGYGDQQVRREFGKMGKSLRNAVTPDDMYESYGADTLRLYEMFTGPLDQSRPVGHQGRGRRVPAAAADLAQRGRRGHRRGHASATTPRRRHAARRCTAPSTRCATAWRSMRFNVSIAKHHRAEQPPDRPLPRRRRAARRWSSRWCCCWRRWPRTWPRSCGPGWAIADSLATEPFPEADPALLVDDDGRDPGAGQRQGAGAGPRPGRRRRRGGRGRGPGRRPGGGPARGRRRSAGSSPCPAG